LAFCSKCGKEIEEGLDTCPHCGQSTSDAPPSVPPRGKLSVEEVLVSSFGLIRRKPLLLVPEIIPALIFLIPLLIFVIPLLSIDIESPESIIENLPVIGGTIIVVFGTFILALLAWFVVQGMYPLMVKNVMEGREVEISDAFTKSLHRLLSIIGAVILLVIMVLLWPGLILAGSFIIAEILAVPAGLEILVIILVIIPMLLFPLWYAYMIPAIMLENLGVLAGMSAGRRFGRTVILKTFLIILTIGLIGGVISGSLEVIPVVGLVIGGIVSSMGTAWGTVAISYAYIKYGMATPAST